MDFDPVASSESEGSKAAAEPVDQPDEEPVAHPAVPAHPEALRFEPLHARLVLPPALQTQLEMQLNCAIEQAATYYEEQERLTPEAALNEARSRAWFHLRNMTAVSLRQTKRSRGAVEPSASSSSTGQV